MRKNICNTSCPRCNKTLTNSNRLVTDSCGHLKCKTCFLDEGENCVQCKVSRSDDTTQTAVSHESHSAKPEEDRETATEVKRQFSSLPPHIRKTQTSGQDGHSTSYECTICSKVFSRTQKYYHFACNDPKNKKYKCGECEKAFSTRFHLNYHLNSHKTTPPGFCAQCPKSSFKNDIVKRNHERLHQRKKGQGGGQTSGVSTTSNQLFACNVCEKRYKTKASLKQHLLKHKGKAYECPTCGKSYQRNTILRLHMRRHKKTENFMCSTCYKNFSDADTLKRHHQIHADSLLKYKCLLCDTVTKRKDNMLRHIRNMHAGVNIQSCYQILRENHALGHPLEEAIATVDAADPVNAEGNDTTSVFVCSPIENWPKTVANSSVIRSVGNVEPIQVPNLVNSPADIPPQPYVVSTTLSVATPINTQAIPNCPQKEAFKQAKKKKPRKPLDPLEIYRKILNTDNGEDSLSDSTEEETDGQVAAQESQTVLNATEVNPRETVESVPAHNFALTPLQAKQFQEQQQHQQQQQERFTVHGSNFSETHWRKNFKFVYQHQKH